MTYNPRNDLNLESKVRKVNDNLCKLMMVTGSTKSGKTVLIKNVISKTRCIWFDGGAYSSEDEFWNQLVSDMEGFTEIVHRLRNIIRTHRQATDETRRLYEQAVDRIFEDGDPFEDEGDDEDDR